MALRVVGAGLGRTGTMSLKLALERLLGGRCYHMFETSARPDDGAIWVAAAHGEAPDWNTFLGDFVATVDWPACDFWQALADDNPDSLVLLSTRESPDAWWKSANATIFRSLERMTENGGDERPWQADFFGPRLSTFMNEDSAKAFYEAHNANVRATVPTERLLDYRAGDGWEPLCTALGVPVPSEPFPHTNTTEEFQPRLEGTSPR